MIYKCVIYAIANKRRRIETRKIAWLIALFACLLLLASCNKNKADSIDYVKVLILGPAIKATAYNKGQGAYSYAYFDLKKDSVCYVYPEFKEEDEYQVYSNKAYTGNFDNQNFNDTLLNLVKCLERRPSGIIDHHVQEEAPGCDIGISYYVEFLNGGEVKYYAVAYGVNDTLDYFYDFFQRLQHSAWNKKPVNVTSVSIDDEVVNSWKRFQKYESLEVPYLFPDCDSSIDLQKIGGRWRTVNHQTAITHKNHFKIFTFNADSSFSIQSYRNREVKELVRGKYSIDIKAQTIYYVTREGQKMTHIVHQLTDSCYTAFHAYGTGGSKVWLNRY